MTKTLEYSDAQRLAIVRRINTDGVAASAAIQEASLGDLADLDPFEPSIATATRWAAEAHRTGEVPATLPPLPEGVPSREEFHGTIARLWRAHVESIDDLERKQAELRENPGDEAIAREVETGMLRAIRRQGEFHKLVSRYYAKGQAPTSPEGGEPTDPTGRDASESEFFQNLVEPPADQETQGSRAAVRTNGRRSRIRGER